MGDPITAPCAVCGMELLQIGICPACGHNQKTLENQEDGNIYEEFDLPYGIESAPQTLEEIRIPYGINHAP
tara:strand:- start:69 stop:281 length:213 start_codon:yes stop_codon:yes gene_type:complete